MKPYTHILFDLDGTITDPAEGITTCVRHALHCQGIEEENYQNLCRMIGPPLAESFERFYGLSRAESERAVAYYRERFTDTGIFENRVIDGIPALLDTISDAGAKLALATSKPQVFAGF